ncbi:energy transducer TonB [Sphingobium xenophagum]|nr:energy transducer TonB [Sphingobium xenophagum]
MFDIADDEETVTQDSASAAGQITEPGFSPAATIEPWKPATRYSDQPMSLKTRLFGMGGTGGITLLIAGGALFTWTTYQAVQKPATLSVFDVAPPAAPPEPAREIPPGPEEVEKDQDMPDTVPPQIEPPEIRVPSTNPLPVPVWKPVPDPAPPAKETTAPETQPAPPAPQMSSGQPTWEVLVLGALNKVKRYPREASFRRQQGVPYIRFVMNRNGEVLSVRLERSSGVRALDNEALALPKRAAPLPKPPKEVAGDTVELVVPVEFFMR